MSHFSKNNLQGVSELSSVSENSAADYKDCEEGEEAEFAMEEGQPAGQLGSNLKRLESCEEQEINEQIYDLEMNEPVPSSSELLQMPSLESTNSIIPDMMDLYNKQPNDNCIFNQVGG